MIRRLFLVAMSASFVAAALVGSASGAKPTTERIQIDESFDDPFLTEACGFPVTVRALGHITFRTWTRNGTGVLQVRTINLSLTATANGKTYRLRDVGVDLAKQTPDGSVILQIVGQIPFDFTGLLKINTTTGEVLLEPQHSTAGEVEDLCATLAPA